MEPTEKSVSYPVFEANQVLSHTHLNQAFDYLDEQGRLTRANLTGIGIVCGLEVGSVLNQDKSATVRISKGCGITSEGYLIVEPDDVQLGYYRELKSKDWDHAKFNGETAFELFPTDGSDTTPLKADDLNDKVVVLLLELKEQPLRNCSPDNCDDKGSAVTPTVRRLLVNTNELQDVPLEKYRQMAFGTPDVPLRKALFAAPADMLDTQAVYKNFFGQTVSGKTPVARLADVISQAQETLKILIPDLEVFDQGGFAAIFTPLAGRDEPAIQYYYDLLRDLTAAYHELRTLLLQQVAICLPGNDLFPRHLALGALDSAITGCRTGWYPSPANLLPRHTLEELRFLSDRLNRMVLNFSVPTGASVTSKLTPSSYGSGIVSGKALPYYFKPETRSFWDATRRGARAEEILSWHVDAASPDHVQNPLPYDLEPYNFFRAEGFINRNITVVTTELGALLHGARLPFSLLYLNADKLGNFLDRHPGLEHLGGVPRGGTLVLLYRESGNNANLALADFALPYRIEKEAASGHLGRVMVKEGGFEWFDSRKHLGNLALREYRYSPRTAVHPEKKQKDSQEKLRIELAQSYVIKVYRYEIQGQSILDNGPVTVEVPIADLVKGQLSAIARALNARFPNGVVFDHLPKTNKLLIRLFDDHSFLIEWGGLQGNQIRYQYTDKGIYRRQKAGWGLLSLPEFVVQWSLRNEYRPDEYIWLQQDDYFDADYPTPIPLPTPQDLITWEKMIKGRAPKTWEELPIKGVLTEIKNVMSASPFSKVVVTLVGSWAKGSWCCLEKDGKNNFPAGFVTLRQRVRGRTGVSDIDLLVDTAGGTITADAILAALKPIAINSGYTINVMIGKRGEQKGLILI
ncbi:MAG TPA: hypothetical protein VI298_02730 [Geobacteraceae bacterium]